MRAGRLKCGVEDAKGGESHRVGVLVIEWVEESDENPDELNRRRRTVGSERLWGGIGPICD